MRVDEVPDLPGYEILGLIGRGGMGVVYRARQVTLDRVVALKTIPTALDANATLISRFEREARIIGRLSHPHIVAAHDFGRHGDRLYLAMEFVAGKDVQTLIDEKGFLDEWTAWGIVRQAATALDHAARQGLIHRDIKPANLLVCQPPTGFALPAGMPMVKVADFGLARLAEMTDDQLRLTQANRALGTPLYMAPEQFLGGDVGSAADMYALGTTAACMLAGRPPLAGLTMPEIVAAHMRGDRRSVRDLRPDVSAASAMLVEEMTAPEAAQRIASYDELLRRIDALRLVSPAEVATTDLAAVAPLAAVIADGPERPHPTPTSRNHRPASARWPFSVAAVQIAVLGLLAAAMVAWAMFAGPRPARPARSHALSGRSTSLFDGSSLASWRTIDGGWSIARNDEGAVVLQGQGLVSRSLVLDDEAPAAARPEHYHVAMLVDRARAATADIQFDLPPDGAAGGCMVVRIDADTITCGSLPDEAGALQPRAKRPLNDHQPLHAVGIERHDSAWWITVDGKPLAVAPLLRAREAGVIRLAASGGEAQFSDITIEPLVPSAASRPEAPPR